MIKPATIGVYLVSCAACPASVHARGSSSWEAYQCARAAGWSVDGRLDYCRRCTPPASPSRKRAPSRRR